MFVMRMDAPRSRACAPAARLPSATSMAPAAKAPTARTSRRFKPVSLVSLSMSLLQPKGELGAATGDGCFHPRALSPKILTDLIYPQVHNSGLFLDSKRVAEYRGQIALARLD